MPSNDELKILSDKYWNYADKRQSEFLRVIGTEYSRLQDGLNIISEQFKKMSGVLNITQRQWLARQIKKAAESDYYNNLILELYMKMLNNHQRITRTDAMECVIMGLYAEHYEVIYKKSCIMIQDICLQKYNEITESNRTSPIISGELFTESLPDGSSPKQKFDIEVQYRTHQMAKAVTSQIIADKDATAENPIIKQEIQRSKNAVLTKTADGHFHGLIDRVMTGFVGYAVIEAAKRSNAETYTFYAVIDNKTTPVCRGLNGRTFKVSEMRLGYNVPPVMYYMNTGLPIPHPCRSWIVLNL